MSLNSSLLGRGDVVSYRTSEPRNIRSLAGGGHSPDEQSGNIPSRPRRQSQPRAIGGSSESGGSSAVSLSTSATPSSRSQKHYLFSPASWASLPFIHGNMAAHMHAQRKKEKHSAGRRRASTHGHLSKSFEPTGDGLMLGASLNESYDGKPRSFRPPKLQHRSLTVGDSSENYVGDTPWEHATAQKSRNGSRVGDGLSTIEDTSYLDDDSMNSTFDDAADEIEDVGPAPATTIQTLFNSINVLLGVGVLTVPYAISEGGWAAVAVLALLGLITNYTAKLLWDMQVDQPISLHKVRDAEYAKAFVEDDDPLYGKMAAVVDEVEEPLRMRHPSYPEIGELAFGKCGRRVVSFALFGELFCALVLFIILMGTNLIIVLPDTPLSVVEWMCISAAAVLPLCWLRSMALLSWFSFLGVMSSISLVVSIVAYSFLGTCAGGSNCSNVEHPDPEALNLTEGLVRENLPMSVGLLMFCFAGHSVFPEIMASMKTVADGPKVMNQTFAVSTTLYVFLAVVGYLWLGISSPEQVTQALPPGWVSLAVTWLLLGSTYTKLALGFSPIAVAFEDLLPCIRSVNPKPLPCTKGKKFLKSFLQIVLRTVLVGLALIVAVTIPCFGSVRDLPFPAESF
eukprot:INCI16042.2.p1 GENE.INCI16042.2~~INCI16042.2.p1  ORF type:complete len:623 (+),score=69.95 INCI16042.2:243-2111(+)